MKWRRSAGEGGDLRDMRGPTGGGGGMRLPGGLAGGAGGLGVVGVIIVLVVTLLGGGSSAFAPDVSLDGYPPRPGPRARGSTRAPPTRTPT